MARTRSEIASTLRRRSVEAAQFAEQFDAAADAAEAAPPGSNDALIAETRARALRAMGGRARSSAWQFRDLAERLERVERLMP